MYGFAGKLLFIDLTNKTYNVEELSEQDARNFLGGHGLGAKVLFDRMPANTPVFAPESMLGFCTGPTNGSAALFGGRYTVVSKSPVTNAWNDANSGGNFGPQLKRAGYDAVFFSGISEKPVYVLIDNGAVEFRDASAIWGKTVIDTENAIRAELGDDKVGIAMIGPAGERMSHMAAIMNDTHRAAGRGGTGAVMGSKKLKALVVRGKTPIEVFDRAAMLQVSKEAVEWEKGPVAPIFDLFYNWGTASTYESQVYSGDTSIHNWDGNCKDLTDEDIKALAPQTLDPKWRQKKYACNACPLGCGSIYKILEGKYPMEETSRPEYETVGAFGPMMMNNDPLVINQCNFLCNEYGFDTISTGATIAWLMDAYNKGYFTKDELDGIDLKWGNGDAILQVMEKMCAGEGIGAVLQNGSKYSADYYKKGEDCLVTAGGIEPPQHDSRFSTQLTRTYKYDPTPGRHTKGGFGGTYGNEPPEVKFNYSNTGEKDVAATENQEIVDSAGFCLFGGSAFGLPQGAVLKYLNAITGFNYDEEEWHRMGQRLFAIRHAFNLREGFRRKDCYLTPKLEGKPPMEDGPLAGVTVDTEQMADNFFRVLKYDVETAMIPKDVLEWYGGMEKVIEDLYPEK